MAYYNAEYHPASEGSFMEAVENLRDERDRMADEVERLRSALAREYRGASAPRATPLKKR